MNEELRKAEDGSVRSSQGWAIRFVSPELIEYCTERAACLVNVSHTPGQKARQIYASESSSDLFPHLREHLASAARFFQGAYVIV